MKRDKRLENNPNDPDFKEQTSVNEDINGLDSPCDSTGIRSMNDIFKELKAEIQNDGDQSDSGGSDSDPFQDDLTANDLQQLHVNMLYIIENFKQTSSQGE